jgi:hypothetical protein
MNSSTTWPSDDVTDAAKAAVLGSPIAHPLSLLPPPCSTWRTTPGPSPLALAGLARRAAP